MFTTGFEDAAACLDSLAAGVVPDRTSIVIGALALDALRWTTSSRDLLDAAAGLAILASGGSLDLDQKGRRRARELAAVIRAIAGHHELPAVSRASHFS